MTRGGHTLRHMVRGFLPALRKRSAVLRKFADTMGLVYFGSMNQHEDDYEAIRGFTASLSHLDSHYAVGTYEGFDIRMVDRFDSYKRAGNKHHEQLWLIMEVDLQITSLPHVFLVPTGHEAGEYDKLFTTQPHMQPLNTMLLQKHSMEVHGRYQILSRTTNANKVEHLLPTPVMMGIASRFWPHGVEISGGKVYLYITQHRLSKTVLESSLASLLWLAAVLDESNED